MTGYNVLVGVEGRLPLCWCGLSVAKLVYVHWFANAEVLGGQVGEGTADNTSLSRVVYLVPPGACSTQPGSGLSLDRLDFSAEKVVYVFE